MHQKQPIKQITKQQHTQQLIIGYYPIRGKAQVPRLICQYLEVDYRDQLYQLDQWDKFRRQSTKQWDFTDLPYLQDAHFVVTEAFPICEYVIHKKGALELLGKTVSDQAIVQMYLWTIDTMGNIISINCSKIPEQDRKAFKQNQWKTNVLPRMLKYEQFVKGEKWFLGYLTIIDFSIYELMRYMQMLFVNTEEWLPKLNKIKRQISNLPQIKSYEQSEKAVKEMDPSVLLKRLKKN